MNLTHPPAVLTPLRRPARFPLHESDHRRENRRGLRLQVPPRHGPGGSGARGRGQGGALLFLQRARLPGFRPGKAPEAVVRKRFGDAIRQSVLEEVIRESWETAKTAESLKPVTDPSIRNLKFEDGSPIEFDLLVEVRPEIKLERTGGFRLERAPWPPSPMSAVDGAARPASGAEGRLDPVEGDAQPSPGPDGPGRGRADRGRRSPAPRSPTTSSSARIRRFRTSRSGS